ncbi:DUF1697 domain-containing protein [Nocardia huaxiensis]|uniref:DUF1697 domain-containing protein n=1 Tax=Nocardia huaxiensis TaxID=2755382 RepID=A0A7D6VB79_9NOCA|nr:DUF1697 domain-containing protein [Nocardia huaxiensis]QLY30082.1 DUF1697 domain-containing protein [Nocardia huaxiensis]UFS96312.1 DUF1697 domain-containing protein [Nocardia huaxiensis]
MNRYAAFIRGIMPTNPNMRNEKLRAVFEGLGFEQVASLLTSGNIVFHSEETDTAALESRIQQALHAELGIPGGTLVRSREQLRAMVDADPFPGLTHCRETYLTVTFVREAPAQLPELPSGGIESAVELVGYDQGAGAVLSVIDNSDPGTPSFMAWLEKVYGKDITTRTFLTVQKTLKKLNS